MQKISLIGVSLLTIALAGCIPGGSGGPAASSSAASSISTAPINLSQPQPNATVTSPLSVSGEAPGTWFFEASFPVRLLDGNGQEIAVMPAQAQSDWMTTDYVPFLATLTFTTPSTSTGTLVLEKDNPSGEPQNAASIQIPVQF